MDRTAWWIIALRSGHADAPAEAKGPVWSGFVPAGGVRSTA